MPRVTIRDVAKRAQVGVGTVSRVLNDSPQVSESTRQKVLAVIEELDFHPSSFARKLSTGKSLAIGVIVPFFTHQVFVGRLEGVQAVMAKSEYDFILYNVETPEQSAKLFNVLPRQNTVDGLLIMTLNLSAENVDRFRQANMPVVLVDAEFEGVPGVVIDDLEGGRLATQHLIDLGHRRIGFISDSLESAFGFQSSKRRCDAYHATLENNGIEVNADYCREAGPNRHSAYRAAQELMALDNPPTAIFAASDTQAFGVLEAMQEMGLDVPGGISVVGYDDIEVAAYVGLTTVHQPMYQMGVESIEMLLQIIAGHEQTGQVKTLPVNLVERKSTAPPAS